MVKTVAAPDSSFAKSAHAIAYLPVDEGQYQIYTGIVCYSVVTYSKVPLLGIRTYFPKRWFWPEHYLRKVIDETPFGKVILTKDLEEAKVNGFEFDVEASNNLVVAAMQMLRTPFEFSCCKTIDTLAQHGATAYECVQFALNLNNERLSSYRNPNHTPFSQGHCLKALHEEGWVANANPSTFSKVGGIKYGDVSDMFKAGDGHVLKYLDRMMSPFKVKTGKTDVFGGDIYETKSALSEENIKQNLIQMRKDKGYEV